MKSSVHNRCYKNPVRSQMPSIVFLIACACHAMLATPGMYTFNAWGVPYPSDAASWGSALALVIALVLGLLSLDRRPVGRVWTKAAIVFLALGPIAFFGLLYPAIRELVFSNRCYDELGLICPHLISDVKQSQIAMAVVAWSAAACAAFASAPRTNRTLSPASC